MRWGKERSGNSRSLIGGGMPQVNLLPASVRAARGFKTIGRWLVIYGLVVFVVLGGVLFFAWSAHQDAKSELQAQEDRRETLLLEQRKYAHVPLVIAEVENTQNALWFATSTEVMWGPYFRALAAVAPEGVSYDSMAYTGASAIEPPSVEGAVFSERTVGAISFVARSLTVPDTAAWVENLNAVPGFQDAWFSDATISAVEEETYYLVNGSVSVTERAWAKRFAPESAEAAVEAEAEPTASGEGE